MYYAHSFLVITLLPRKEEICTKLFDNYDSTV